VRESRPYPHPRRRTGFTLVEAAITTAIIGLGFVAVMELFTGTTRQNATADHMTSAMMLAGQMEEMLALLPMDDPTTGSQTSFGPEEASVAQYDDLDDFAGAAGAGTTFSPPVDCRLQAIPSLSQYTQRITVTRVLPDALDVTLNGYTGACRVDISISLVGDSGAPLHRHSFVRFDE
jgi:type II secretory pathway pseudopilin PulG